jgi:hypothetical protein
MMQRDPLRKPQQKKVRAYRVAPWRAQTRLLSIGLSAVLGLIAVLGLFIFTGAQAAEAGLRVQSLIRERDDLLRRLELQGGELARRQSEEIMQRRAEELGFVPATAAELEFLPMPSMPAKEPDFISPTSFLYTEQPVSISPAYKETLLEWILNVIRPAEGG